jgi:hypothetical protein
MKQWRKTRKEGCVPCGLPNGEFEATTNEKHERKHDAINGKGWTHSKRYDAINENCTLLMHK